MTPFLLTAVLYVILAILLSCFVDEPSKWISLILSFLSFGIFLVLGVVFARLNFFLRAICRIKAGAKTVCLTFDDGPDAKTTPYLLDLLAEEKAVATFFCIGKHVRTHRTLVKRIHEQGHLLGNHSFHHYWWTNFLLGKGLHGEIHKTQEAIREIIGRTPRYFRSPMGLSNPHLKRALKQNDLVFVGWDIRSFDRKANSAKAVVRRVVNSVRDGSIILLHDGGVNKDMLLAITRELILQLRKRGFSFSRIDTKIRSVKL